MRVKLGIIAVAALAGACAGPVETHMAIAGQMPKPGDSFALLTAPAIPGGDTRAADAAALVAAHLKARGYVETAQPAWLMQVALSERPAGSGIASGKQGWVEKPKTRRLLQNCEDREYRLSIVFLDRATGAIGRSVQAAEYHCNGTLAEVLPHLVTAALSARSMPVRYRLGRD